MQCPSCNANVADGGKFCAECGAPLPRPCAVCGHANSARSRFCSECGASITVAVPASSAATSPPSAPSGSIAERRQVTIMFCDLVGSTALSARLDPEDMREIIGSYHHRCCAEQITKAGI